MKKEINQTKMKDYSPRTESEKEMSDFLYKIDWQPKQAAFQLSQNKRYARHDALSIDSGELKIERVIEEVQRAWRLKPIGRDVLYYYFGY